MTQWAFDPGLDFSTQLFFDDGGIAVADGSHGAPRCRRCGAGLARPENVTLTATAAVLEGLVPIGARVRLVGYRCASCSLEQAPPGEFDARGFRSSRRSSDSGKALDAAVRSIGLSP